MTVAGRVWLSVVLLVAMAVSSVGLFTPAEAQPPAEAPRPSVLIKELTVEGNRRVQDAVIVGAVKSKIGGPFNPSTLSEDLRAIFALGFFDDVQMRVEGFEGGVKVTFVVIERPFVRDVQFSGNKKITTSSLQEKVDLKLGRVYNPVEVQRAREKLQEHYEEEGYFEVQITPEVDKFPDGDVRVVFSINEGRRMTIERLVIQGNRGLTEKQIKGAMATQERQYFILRGTVQRQRLEEDVERILVLYNDHGYIQARVESHDLKVDRQRARVTIQLTLVEGPQYRVGDVKLTGVTLLPEVEVRRQVKLRPGDVFSRSKVRESVRAVTDLYSAIGRASAEVLPKTDQQAAIHRIDITFEVSEGPEVYVDRINITGNVRSQDKILRREIPMVEGDLFTLQKLQRARQRLVNLGYFETVNAMTQPGSDKTKIIVNIEVTERATGLFSIGGGFSSVDGLIGTLDLSQRNFLGRGWEVALRIRGGAKTQQGTLSFTEPWLFDRPLSAGVDLFDLRRSFDEYDVDSIGGGFRLSHPFGEHARWFVQYRVSRDKVKNVRDPTLVGQEGIRVTSSITPAVARDTRDNILAPTRGSNSSLSVDIAGLGGDSHFVKMLASTSYFQPIWLNHVLSGRIEGGYGFGLGSDTVPIFERFYLGGPNSIRSFKFRKLSPIDRNGFPIGGTSELLGNVEYIVPLPFQIRLAGFFDIGNTFGFAPGPGCSRNRSACGTQLDPTDLRKAAGAGIRWNSPFGPIRIDYGINLDRKAGEKFGALNFSVGSPF